MSRNFVAAIFSALFVIFAASACNRSATPPSPVATTATAPVDPWVLTTLDAKDTTPALLWNGLVGFRIGRDGGGKGQPFFSIDEYDTTGEEKIRSMDSPLPNGFIVDGGTLPVTGDYRQSLDVRTAELTTHWKSGAMTVDCVTVLHPNEKIIAQRWTLTGFADTEHTLDFDTGSTGKLGKETMLASDILVGPSKMRGKMIVTRTQTPNPTVEFVLTMGRSPNWYTMQEARTPGIEFFEKTTHLLPPSLKQFTDIEKETASIWANRWQTDIEIDGPVEDQQAVRSFLFYLRSAIHQDGGMSISPFGLSNQMYNGHVFWDADIWVFPALMLIDPVAAKAIADYRLALFAAAGGRTAAAAKAKHTYAGGICKYPWESSVSGKETVIGPSQKELHITGDVAWSLRQASDLGLATAEEAKAVVEAAAAFYGSIASSTAGNTQEISIKDVMSPDENHTGDNDLYTNLLAQWVDNGGAWAKFGRVGRPALPYHLPHDNKSFLTYDGDPVKSYKQAAAVLSIYPLQYPPAEKEAKVMMDRFADKVTKNGPAMSDSVHALIWARLGEAGKAYDTWRKSWQPFTKQPLMLFSEKRNKPTTYFSTGAGGCMQTVLFGFLGFRLDSVAEQDAAWSKQLQGNSWLSIKPNLPKNWKSVKLKNFSVLGHRYTLTATQTPSGPAAVQVIQGDRN